MCIFIYTGKNSAAVDFLFLSQWNHTCEYRMGKKYEKSVKEITYGFYWKKMKGLKLDRTIILKPAYLTIFQFLVNIYILVILLVLEFYEGEKKMISCM